MTDSWGNAWANAWTFGSWGAFDPGGQSELVPVRLRVDSPLRVFNWISPSRNTPATGTQRKPN